MVGMLEVDVFQSERIAPAVAVSKVVSVPIEQESVLQGEVVVLSARVAQVCDYAIHLGFGQMSVFILCGKKRPQIVFYQWVGIFPVNVIAECILPMRFVKESDSRLLKLTFIIFSFACHNRCCLRMYDVLKQCRTYFS